MSLARPLVAVTMGDPAGIGPEIVVKALVSGEIQKVCRPIVIGSLSYLRWTAEVLGVQAPFTAIGDLTGPEPRDLIEIIDIDNIQPGQVALGLVSAKAGKVAMEYVKCAAESCLRGDAAAMATAPINKEAINRAGYQEPGHMEYLARLTGASQHATMLATGPLRVVHLSTHVPLSQACALVTKERVIARLELVDREFRKWGMARPRIGVAALNPHGGEGGLLGREEIEQIVPAVQEAKARGIDARGPFPADSIFVKALAGELDVVLAMYHDQGHIPIKVHGFEASISVALGLPIIRTSVDHGTAFDIAGKGIANPRSLIEAIKVAALIAQGRWLHKSS